MLHFISSFFRARSKRSWLDKWSYQCSWIQYKKSFNLGLQIRNPSIGFTGCSTANGFNHSWSDKKFWSRSMKCFIWKAWGLNIWKFPQNFNVDMNFSITVFMYLPRTRWKNFSITFQTQFLQIGVQISILKRTTCLLKGKLKGNVILCFMVKILET